MAFPPDKLRSEEPNYGRAWFTHGLIEAAIAGNPKAYPLLRGHADWFNQWDEMLAKLIYWSNNSHQGHIASTRTYFTPIGKPDDLQVAEKYYVMDWWLAALRARQEEAVWQFPLQNPHSYLITSFEAYLDHYRATGDNTYLDAMLRDTDHERRGTRRRAMAICESQWKNLNGERRLTALEVTATCDVWQRVLDQNNHGSPARTGRKMATEIENHRAACCSTRRAREPLSARFGAPRTPTMNNTCRHASTRSISLPEHISAEDGLYVNPFELSAIRWQVANCSASL